MSDHRTLGGPRLARRIPLLAAVAIPFAVATFGGAKEARAQAWLRDRSYQEGIGVRVGDSELHPGVGAEVGYDSNWYARSHKDPPAGQVLANGGVREAGTLRVTPSLTIQSLGPQRLGQAAPSFSYRGSVAGTYREFFGTEVNAERNMNVHAFFRGDVLPGRPVGVGFFGGYQRMVQPSAIPAGAGGLTFDRSDLNAGAEVIVIPGQGTLDLHLGYQFFGALYENTGATSLSNLTHEVSFKNRWKFRPKTALFTETSVQFVSYPNSDRSILTLNDAVPVRTRAGVTGLVLPRLSVVGALGYSATFLAGGGLNQTSQFDSINAQAEATIYLTGAAAPDPTQAVTAVSTLTLGYSRDVLTGSAQSFANKPTYLYGGGQNTVLGSYTGLDKIYGRLSYMFAGRAILALDGFVDILTLPALFDANGGTVAGTAGGFSNLRPGASLFGEYRFVDSFGLNLTVDYAQQISDVVVPVGGNQVFDLNNRRVQASLGARWFM